jgi:antitoxin Phd
MEYTPRDLAVALGLSPKAVRHHMREQGIRVGKGARHSLDKKTYERLLRELKAKQETDAGAWSLADAKNSFSEVVTLALTQGPQRVRRRDESVIILAESEYRKLTGNRPSFKAHLLNGPSFEGLDLTRDKTPARDVDL